MALVGYGLFLFACVNGITAIVGVVIAYIKRDEARGTVYESHFANMITTFWVSLALMVVFFAAIGFGAATLFSQPRPDQVSLVVGAGIALYGVGVVYAIWFLYRIIRGFIRALDASAF